MDITTDLRNAENRELFREIFRAKLRAVFAKAYAYRLQRGWSLVQMCERAQMTEKQFRALMNVHDGVSLGHIGVFFYALDLDFDFKMAPLEDVNYHSASDDAERHNSESAD